MKFTKMNKKTLNAPFTEEEVEKINKFQNNIKYHPYTCGSPDWIDNCSRKTENFSGEFLIIKSEGKLIAKKEGLVCPCGKYIEETIEFFDVD